MIWLLELVEVNVPMPFRVNAPLTSMITEVPEGAVNFIELLLVIVPCKYPMLLLIHWKVPFPFRVTRSGVLWPRQQTAWMVPVPLGVTGPPLTVTWWSERMKRGRGGVVPPGLGPGRFAATA